MSDIRVILDNDLKSSAEMVFENLDITMSQAVRMFLKQVVRTGEMPFNPYQKTFSKETDAAIKRSKSKKNLTTHKDVGDMFKSWDEE
ncbi:MAG: addiction module RelB/DinJ family antitoxin [Rickettsiales bacterium]|jgi:addiction module RelB/DinJ family antitoxin